MNEVPRRQSTGPFAPRDVVAEIEDGVEEVFEDETEDGVEPGHEIESEDAGARRSRGVPDRSILRFFSMAAPKFSAAPFTSRGAKIASGPSRKKINGTGPLIPHAREKISFTLLSLCRSTNASIRESNGSSSLNLLHRKSYCGFLIYGIGGLL